MNEKKSKNERVSQPSQFKEAEEIKPKKGSIFGDPIAKVDFE